MPPSSPPNPYSAPHDHPAPAKSLVRSRLFLAASLVATFLTCCAIYMTRDGVKEIGIVGFGVVALLAFAGVIQGLRRRSPLGVLANTIMVLLGGLAAYIGTWTFSRGRQLRVLGRVLLPPVRLSKSPHTTCNDQTSKDQISKIDAPVETAAGIAAQWRENARTEHASVAAFAHLTLDLMALGAPTRLIEGAQRDALDEIRHTDLCFALAQRFDGREAGPGAFPEARKHSQPQNRTLALARLAVDSLVDGALNEGVSARVIAALARRSQHAEVTAVLKEIAADEGRHAAHGWDVVRWCHQQGGEPVASALLGAIRALPKQMHSPRPAAAADGSWERWGIHGDTLEAEQYALARKHLLRRVHQLVGSKAAPLAA